MTQNTGQPAQQAQSVEPAAVPVTDQEPVASAGAEQTVAVTYTGEDSWLLGTRLVEPGQTIELPAEEVEAWGHLEEPPEHLQRAEGAVGATTEAPASSDEAPPAALTQGKG